MEEDLEINFLNNEKATRAKRKTSFIGRKYKEGGEIDPPKKETAYDDLKSEMKNKAFSKKQQVDLTSVRGQDTRKKQNVEGGTILQR